jgi:hypothetical protein
MTLDMEFEIACAMVVIGISAVVGALLYFAIRLSVDPSEECWRSFCAEFRWAFRNALQLQRDLLCSPITGVRLAFRKDDRRRKTHRRNRHKTY